MRAKSVIHSIVPGGTPPCTCLQDDRDEPIRTALVLVVRKARIQKHKV